MWKITDKTGAARKAPHANSRTPGALKTASRKRHRGEGVVGKGSAGVIKHDRTWHKEPAPPKHPPELQQAARQLGMSCKLLASLLKAQKAGVIS